MIHIALALVLFVHAVAHLPGFLVSWRIASLKELPYKTTVLAGSFEETPVSAFSVLFGSSPLLVSRFAVLPFSSERPGGFPPR